MKWKAVIVLVTIMFSIVVPSSLPLLSDHGTAAAIGTLDVCHSATPAISSNGDMPFMSANAIHHLPQEVFSITDVTISPLIPFIVALQDELPPKR